MHPMMREIRLKFLTTLYITSCTSTYIAFTIQSFQLHGTITLSYFSRHSSYIVQVRWTYLFGITKFIEII